MLLSEQTNILPETFAHSLMLVAPKRGEIVREIGNEMRRLVEPLGKLISLEMGNTQ